MEYSAKGRDVLFRESKTGRWKPKLKAKTPKRAQRLAELCNAAVRKKEETKLTDDVKMQKTSKADKKMMPEIKPGKKSAADKKLIDDIMPVVNKARKVALAKTAYEFNEDVKIYLNEMVGTLIESASPDVILHQVKDIKQQNENILRYLRRLLKA